MQDRRLAFLCLGVAAVGSLAVIAGGFIMQPASIVSLRSLRLSLIGMFLTLLCAVPAVGGGGRAGCCIENDGTCKSPVREAECKSKNIDYCKMCKDGQCVQDDNPGTYLCVDDKTGKRYQGCEKDTACPKGTTCKLVRQKPEGKLVASDGALPCCGCEIDPPTCFLKARRQGPPVQIDIQAQDMESGLLAIEPIIQDNASVAIPLFEPGTIDPVIVTATKIDQLLASRVELEVTDLAGNTTRCDPILTDVIRSTGHPSNQSYSGLHELEDTVEIHNSRPGLKNLEIVVNGMRFRAAGLQDGEVRTIDVSEAVLPGTNNVFVLRSYGKPGASATVFIWEGEP